MLRFALKRLFMALLVLAAVSVIAFSLVHLSGDPAVAMAGEGASAADVAAIRTQFGFDRPLYRQYVDWVGKVLSGEFGRSHYLKKNVVDVLAEHLPITAWLGVTSLAFALLLAIPLGVLAALRPNTLIDRAALTVAVMGQSLPSFLVAFLLIYLLGVQYRLLPITGNETWLHFVMPTIALGYYAAPAIMRLTRAGMIETLQSDYIRMARAKGLSASKVVFKHALRNALVPVVALAAVQFGLMLGGSVVVETVFSLRGLGHLAWQSIQRSDFEVMQAIVLVVAAFYAVLTFLADLLNGVIDPRIRVG
jgi:peptide/nickel transport system permease protein